jgi:hypothetical protein
MARCLNEFWDLDKLNQLGNDLKGKTNLNQIEVSDNKDKYVYLSGKTK